MNELHAQQMKSFIIGVALLTKDGELVDDGRSDVAEPFVMESDDAVDTLNTLISEAREIAKEMGW